MQEFLWILLFGTAITATIRGWSYIPWVMLLVPFFCKLYVDEQIRLVNDRIGDLIWEFGQISDTIVFRRALLVLRQDKDAYDMLMVITQLVVLLFFIYFSFVKRTVQLQPSVVTQNPIPKVTNEFNERITKLDSLLQNNLIDAEEYRQRKFQIDQEWEASDARKSEQQIVSMAKPYESQLRAYQLLRDREMISQKVFETERRNVLRRLLD